MNDELFLRVDDLPDEPDQQNPWRILVVDDEPEMHRITRLALSDFKHGDRSLELHSAYSAAEAISFLENSQEIALILLDVVMESDEAGFDVIRHVRETMNNRSIRIILRTGQPGQAPPKNVVRIYDINDYHNKVDLTAERMFTSIYTALSMFEHLQDLARKEALLASAYNNIEQLVHIASHDLQEPIRTITTLSDRLQNRNHEQLDAAGKQCINYIDVAALHMRDMVNDLLEHSRIGQKQPTEQLQICALIDELRVDMEASISVSNAIIRCSADTPILAQRTKIKLLLQNLLSNAIKYRKPGTAPNIDISVTSQGRMAIISVADDGIGIPEIHHKTIFNLFARLHDKKKYQGTGIGLTHCKKIVELHGGEVLIESGPDQGTTIICKLPNAIA